MPGLLANACLEEPDALIALVRVCGGAPRVTGGLYPENSELGQSGVSITTTTTAALITTVRSGTRTGTYARTILNQADFRHGMVLSVMLQMYWKACRFPQ